MKREKKICKKLRRKRDKKSYPIFKKKDICYLCKSNKNLTYHHIIPQREVILNGDDNIMVLCRKCHNIIDVNKKVRITKCYEKNKKIIDKYNKYLKKNLFQKDLFWELYEEKVIIKKSLKGKAKKVQGNGLNKNRINLNEYKWFRDHKKLDKLFSNKSKK